MKYLLLAFSLMLSGCAQTLWEHKPKDAPLEKHEGGWEDSYNYYVVDPNSDIPDAFFKTLNEEGQNNRFSVISVSQKIVFFVKSALRFRLSLRPESTRALGTMRKLGRARR